MGQRQYVGIDLHRRRSVIVRMDAAGEVVGEARIDNEPLALAAEVARAGPAPEIAIEATLGWYWAVDVLEDLGCSVHLAHPLGIGGFENRRVKNDRLDARLLADLLRLGRLPEAWIAPKEVRELRELVRYRHKLVDDRSGLKAQVHSVLAKAGVRLPINHLWGPNGAALLDTTELPDAYCTRVESLRDLIAVYDREVAMLDRVIARRLEGHAGYRAIQAIPGVGPVLAAVFVAEIGDVGRFKRPAQLCCWAGLTPRHRESDTKVRRGRITKMACGRDRLTGRSATASGGDRDHLGRPRHPSGPADLRLRRHRHRRGAHRQDRPCGP
ncbi:MAG TPA: IS110 family transposase [Acidimicrobiales bacterium]|nr:IS110 family transposase [Acidimicrobiales bacterium]